MVFPQGSLALERGSPSACHQPWYNCNSSSDSYDRGRVRRNGEFVSGDPKSEPGTRDLPPNPLPMVTLQASR